MLEFWRFWIKYSKICKTTAKKASWWLCYHLLPRICFTVKVAFFQKNQLGIGVWWGKPGEMGQNWILEPLFSEIWVIMLQTWKYFNICLNFTTKGSKIHFLTNFRQLQPTLTYAKLILLKKRNFYAKCMFWCNLVLYLKKD